MTYRKIPGYKYVAVAIYFLAFGFLRQAIAQNESNHLDVSTANQKQRQECVDEATKILGKQAELLRCGALNDPKVIESVAVIQKGKGAAHQGTYRITQLVILRHESSGWKLALSVSKQIKNDAGYIGIDYIDDSAFSYGYLLKILDQRDDGKKAFVLRLSYLLKDGNVDDEALPIEIAWDPSVRRYREFDINVNVNSRPPTKARNSWR